MRNRKPLFAILAIATAFSFASAQDPEVLSNPIGAGSTGGELSMGYTSDYIFNGAHLAADSIWADVHYTYDGLPLPVTVGVFYLTSLGPNAGAGSLAGGFGDQADIYALVHLPEIMGIHTTLGYIAHTYPTNTYGVGSKSSHEISLEGCTDILPNVLGGFTANFRIAHDFNQRGFPNTPIPPVPPIFIPAPKPGQENAWIFEAGLCKNIPITDDIRLELEGGVVYTDNYWFNAGGNSASGWNHYYLQANLPITLNNQSTLTPYIGYNGTPSGWVLNGSNSGWGAGNTNWGQNANDVLHWGVSLNVPF